MRWCCRTATLDAARVEIQALECQCLAKRRGSRISPRGYSKETGLDIAALFSQDMEATQVSINR